MKIFRHLPSSRWILLPFLLTASATASNFTWNGGSINNDWSSRFNWSPSTAPPLSDNTTNLTFSGGTRTSPNAQEAYTLRSILFSGTTASFTLSGSTLTLAGSGPFVRNETGNAHTIQNGLTFSTSGTISAQNGNLTLGGTLGTGIVAGNTVTLNANLNRTLTLGSSIGGFGSLSKTGPGTLRFNGLVANTGTITMGGGTMELAGQISGTSGITFNSGTIRLLADNRIPTLPIALPSGTTLDLNGFSDEIGALTGSGAVTLGSGGVLTVNQSTSTTYSSTISGTNSAGFTKSGTGTLSLEGTIALNGTTTVAGGTLRTLQNFTLPTASAHHIASGAILNINGTTQFIGSLSGGGTISLGAGSLTVSQTADTIFDGRFFGDATSTFTKTSAGTLTLASPSSSFNGSATVAQGRLVMQHPSALGSAASTITVQNSGTLEFDQDSFTLADNKTLTLSGSGTSGQGALRVEAVTESILVTVLGNINLAAPTTLKLERQGIFNSTLRFGPPSSAGTATLNLSTHGLTVSGESPGSFRCYSAIIGSGAMMFDIPGNVEWFAASPSFTGPLTIQRGNFTVVNAGALGGGGQPVTIGAPAIMLLPQPSYAPARPLLLAGEMRATGSTSWLATGDITVSPNALLRATNTSTMLTIGGTGIITGVGPLIISADAISNTVQADRPIQLSSVTGIVKNGSGVFQLNGACTYTGPTTINSGTIRTGAPGLLSPTSPVTLLPGTLLNLDGHAQTIASLSGSGTVILGAAELTLLPSTSTSFTGVISGSGGSLKVGAAIAGAAQTLFAGSTFTGPTEILSGGTLTTAHSSGNPLSTTARLTIAENGTLNNFGTSLNVGSLAGGGTLNNTVSFGFGGDNTSTTFSGQINGNGSFSKSGTGTFTLDSSATSTLSGQTNVLAGTFIAKSGLPSTAVSVSASGTFKADATFAGLALSGMLEIGTSPTLHVLNITGGSTIRSNSIIRWSISDWSAASGTGSDQLLTQQLMVNATSLEPAAIQIDAPSTLQNFSDTAKTFVIARSTNPITGFNPAAFTISYHQNTADIPGTWQVDLSSDGRDILLHYTPSAETYQTWIAGFDVGGLDAPTDDPDGDGIPNAIEFVIGGNPQNVNDTNKLPTSEINGSDFVFVFRRTTRSIYLDPAVHHSNTLVAPWTKAIHGIDGVTITINPLDSETDQVSVRIPMTGIPRRFARLEVSIP